MHYDFYIVAKKEVILTFLFSKEFSIKMNHHWSKWIIIVANK